MKSYELSFANEAFEKEKETQEDESKENPYEGQNGLNSEEKITKDSSHPSTESSSCMKISKTIALTFSLVALGLFLEIVGPSMDYLEDLIDGTTEEVSRVLVARSVGYLVGSLAGGYLCDRFSRFVDLFLSTSFLLAAIGTAAAPWCNDMVLLGFMFCLQGLAQGTICTGGNAVALKVWGENTGAPLVAQHLAFGVGALIAPQIVNAFKRDGIPSTSAPPAYTSFFNSSLPTAATTEDTLSDYSDVKYAYVIVGILALCFAVLFCVFYFIDEGSKKDIGPSLDFREILNPGSCADGDTVFSVLFFIFFFLLYIHIVGGERLYSKFFYKFTTDGNANFSNTEAGNVTSLFWFLFTAGRAVNMVAAHFLSPVIIMVFLAVANVINGVAFAIWGNDVEIALWILSGTYGFFISPLFPTGLVWANLYVQVTAVGVSLGYVGSAIGDIIYQYLGGFLFDDVGPESLMYLICGYSVCLALTYIILQIIASKHGQRLASKSSVSAGHQDDSVIIMTISKKI